MSKSYYEILNIVTLAKFYDPDLRYFWKHNEPNSLAFPFKIVANKFKDDEEIWITVKNELADDVLPHAVERANLPPIWKGRTEKFHSSNAVQRFTSSYNPAKYGFNKDYKELEAKFFEYIDLLEKEVKSTLRHKSKDCEDALTHTSDFTQSAVSKIVKHLGGSTT